MIYLVFKIKNSVRVENILSFEDKDIALQFAQKLTDNNTDENIEYGTEEIEFVHYYQRDAFLNYLELVEKGEG